jgi:hypothetical protein
MLSAALGAERNGSTQTFQAAKVGTLLTRLNNSPPLYSAFGYSIIGGFPFKSNSW